MYNGFHDNRDLASEHRAGSKYDEKGSDFTKYNCNF